MEIYNLVSLTGIFILMGVAWLFSADKKRLNWHLIFWGIVLQAVFAIFIFWIPAGRSFFLMINEGIVKILSSAMAGTEFVFGRLALPPGTSNADGETSLGFILAFQAFPAIIFFAALMSVLYFFNIMPMVIRGFAFVFSRLMRVSGAESLCAASNIFVGIESTLTVRPYLMKMTRSELTTILTAGMATVASNVLALYVFLLHDQFPAIAGHLVSASILSAPAALLMSKIIMPESGRPETLNVTVRPDYSRESNLFESIINGANSAVRLIVGIAALLIAVLGLVALLNMVLEWSGSGLNRLLSIHVDWTLEGLLGYLFFPLSLIIGIPIQDAGEIARIIGERAVVTEVTAYQDLATLIKQGILQHPRSAFICTYALCGFAHIPSMAIFVGGVSALIPDRKAELSVIGPRALLAATLACMMTAAIAGTFYNHASILMGY
jgi:CNT family concentrative nucleoside transporter